MITDVKIHFQRTLMHFVYVSVFVYVCSVCVIHWDLNCTSDGILAHARESTWWTPTWCRPTRGMLHVGCSQSLLHCDTGCTKTPKRPETTHNVLQKLNVYNGV